MFRLLTFPFRLVRSTVRFIGKRNSLVLLIGVGVGLLIAPTTGRDLRAKLATRLAARRTGATGGTAAAPVGAPVSPAEHVGV